MSTPTITKLNKDDRNKLSFTIENVDRSIINAIRRTLLKDIPVFVFDTRHEHCIIDINTTRFTNEIIKQRLDCIPLFINDMEINFILLLLLVLILFFLIKISNDNKKGFDSIKARQDYIENKIDDIK